MSTKRHLFKSGFQLKCCLLSPPVCKTSAKANFGNLGLQDKKQACSRLSVQISFQKTTTATTAAAVYLYRLNLTLVAACEIFGPLHTQRGLNSKTFLFMDTFNASD